MFPAAISRSATTVGLSFSHSTVASAPFARRRARFAASSTRLKRLGSFCRQSSTVIRAMALGSSNRGIVSIAGNPRSNQPGEASRAKGVVAPAPTPLKRQQLLRQSQNLRPLGLESIAALADDRDQV